MNKVEIILDSVVGETRITCMRVTYPRIVHSEFMRHRCGSYCSSSSRAIPLDRMIKQYCNFIPDKWRRHQPGMQPIEKDVFSENQIQSFIKDYTEIQNKSIHIAKKLHLNGVSKEQVNRLLEPFSYITHLVQMTDIGYDSFFKLRLSNNAQYEIRQIATMMYDEYCNSKPVERNIHLPFYERENNIDVKKLLMCSSARCARTSFYNHNGLIPSLEEDFKLADSLFKKNHMSPFEFPVMKYNLAVDLFKYNMGFTQLINPLRLVDKSNPIYEYKNLSGNLNNFQIVQFRKILENIVKK